VIDRRHFLTTAASAGLAAAPAVPAAQAPFIELRYYHMRNGAQTQRTSDFLSKCYLPAAQRLGIGPLGFFNTMIGDGSPSILVMAAYPSADAFATAAERLAADKEFAKGFDAYNSMAELSYIRMENTLLRALDGLPRVVVPPTTNRPPLIFELRTYYANPGKMEALHARFRDHTNKLFVKHGMTLIGYWNPIDPKQADEKLIYILAYPSKEAATKSWKDFQNDPDWKTALAKSEEKGGLVAKVESVYMNPTDYSPIK